VQIEPARPHELAPLVADAYQPSEREREVTRLAVRACSFSIGRLSCGIAQTEAHEIASDLGIRLRVDLRRQARLSG
jgi:hypothetical protein